MHTYGRYDLVLDKGNGRDATAEDNKQYIDFGSGIGTNSLGYCDSDWVEAVCNQAKQIQQIIEITDADYRLVANRLLNAIGSCDYFNGTVKCCHNDFYSSLTASLVIYKTSPTPIVAMNDTTDIVPVWWEFHTTTPEGEIMNDFSFSTLKEYLFHE